MPEHPPSPSPPIGAIFDWDGVGIDFHDQHRESWFLLADKIDRKMTPELFSASFGMRNEQIIPGLFKWAEPGDTQKIRELADEKEQLYRELIRRDGLQALDGVAHLLHQLRGTGIPCSVGSSTPRANIEASLELIGLTDYLKSKWNKSSKWWGKANLIELGHSRARVPLNKSAWLPQFTRHLERAIFWYPMHTIQDLLCADIGL